MANNDKMLREHLVYLLRDGGAHAKFDDVVSDFPEKARGKKPKELPYSAWMLLEHMRLAQWDIIEYVLDPKHVSPDFPDGYWPKSPAPKDDEEWQNSLDAFRADAARLEAIVADESNDLLAPISFANNATFLRQC